MKHSFKILAVPIILFQLLSCQNGNDTNSTVNDEAISEVLVALCENDSLKNSNEIIYPKFLKYESEIEYPIVCWERDSFSQRAFNEVPLPPLESNAKNPLLLPNRLAITYLYFLFDKELNYKMTIDDTIFLRKQIEYSSNNDIKIRPLKNGNQLLGDTININRFLKEGGQSILFFSLPIFICDNKFAFIRRYQAFFSEGSGDWILLGNQNNTWKILKTGPYFNKD